MYKTNLYPSDNVALFYLSNYFMEFIVRWFVKFVNFGTCLVRCIIYDVQVMVQFLVFLRCVFIVLICGLLLTRLLSFVLIAFERIGSLLHCDHLFELLIDLLLSHLPPLIVFLNSEVFIFFQSRYLWTFRDTII